MDQEARHPGPPSIYDVARTAGVSPATVSRTFAKPGRVRHETAVRVRAAAAELGYRAQHSQPPAGARTRMIALILTDIANPAYLEVIRGCEDAAAGAGYVLMVANSQESPDRERLAIERAVPSVEAIVLTSSRMSDSGIRQVAKLRPLVMLNRAVQGVPSVIHDNASGTRSALEHLVALGHRSVTYVSGPESSWANGVRWSTLRGLGAELGVRVRRVGPVDPTVDGGRTGVRLWHAQPTTAVVAFNDLVAVGLVQGFTTLGIVVPRDVSVVGFDNASVSALVTPSLTSVASPLHALGETAVRNVLAIAEGARSTGHPVVLPMRLVERGSTASPAASRITPLGRERRTDD
jgi:LacI family transcriptional regulator, repressor for deo operon, udp, cdd, tsx, nupC, and nupG